MKLKSKLHLSFLLIVTVAIAAQCLSLYSLKKAESKINQKLIPSVEKLGHVKQVALLMQWLQYDFQSMYLDLWGYLYTEESFWKKKYSKREAGAEKIVKQLRAIAFEEDQEILKEIEVIRTQLLKEYREIFFQHEKGAQEEAQKRLKDLKIVRLNELLQTHFAEYFQMQDIDSEKMLSDSWKSHADRELQRIAFQSKSILRTSMIYLILGAFFMVTVSVFLSFWMARGLLRSIEILRLYLDRMRRGNWAIKMPQFANDEIGELAYSFNALSNMLHAISDSRQELVRKFERHRQTQKLFEISQKELEEQKMAAFNLMEDAEEARLVTERAAEDIKKTASALANSNKELRESTQLLKTQQQKLVQAEKMSALGTLAAGVAHELNNPLMGILNYIQYAQKKVPSHEKVAEVLKDAEKETKRCTQIISNILTFSRVRSRESIKALEAKSFEDLLDRSIHLLEKRIHEEKIKMIKDPSVQKIRIKMDGSEMEQVLVNLMTNAMDAMGETEIREINVAVIERTKTVEVLFRDTGTGMSESTLSKIFDPFYTTKPTGKGTGLGLSICSTIMQEHGGELLCESQIGKGTVFRLIFPKFF